LASRTYDPRLFARVEFILKRQIEIATQEHYQAKFESWQISVMPGGVSEDQLGVARRKCAVKESALALALKRFNALVLNRTIPEELNRLEHPGDSSRGSSFA
jgi:hypothetical protein